MSEIEQRQEDAWLGMELDAQAGNLFREALEMERRARALRGRVKLLRQAARRLREASEDDER